MYDKAIKFTDPFKRCMYRRTQELNWLKMKTLHFLSLNNFFVSIRIVVRFTHAYRNFVADNDYAILIQIQVIGMLKVGSTVNDIAHHFGCSRQTIHYLMNLYNRTRYVRVRARPGRACVTTLLHYHVKVLTHPRNRSKRQPLLLVFTGFMHKR